ncbi:MAG: tRNA (N6-isopentenyl adenosine(37)-C2)-methylthiotransferase MiaB [Bacteroidetes bacterium]|nr:tRNA (N6-isopentenyl adenosine(37)-C2)-methylthiotransferase MiaB [Bacteroidota bacterium]
MNFSDTEIVLSVLSDYGYNETSDINNSGIILLNTCSVREHAETKIFNRLYDLKKYKKANPDLVIGILGCMAERLRKELLENQKIVDLIIGPDEYRKLPDLLDNVIDTGEKGIAVQLSRIETYDDITPVRREGVSAWISVMRGCDKFCSFCVVPYTRGRERSRELESIVKEAKRLSDEGVKEICLLGQNVNSYKDDSNDFPDLLKACAEAVPNIRIRYITSHPYDLSLKLLETMASYENICKYIHLPIQSGSNRILKLMNRLYTVEQYIEIINNARKLMPVIGLSTDSISCFPTETEEEHEMTLNVMKEIKYDSAFTFTYSPRKNTKAYKLKDDFDKEIKRRRLEDIIELQRKISLEVNENLIGKNKDVLLESRSKKSIDDLMGRTDCNRPVIVPKKVSYITGQGQKNASKIFKPGDLVNVKINKVNSATLFGTPVI